MAGAAHAPATMREVMDIRQAAEYLGISGDTLYRYASEGFVPAFKLGTRWRFRKSLLWRGRAGSSRLLRRKLWMEAGRSRWRGRDSP